MKFNGISTLAFSLLITLAFASKQLFDVLGTSPSPNDSSANSENPNYDHFESLLQDSQSNRFTEVATDSSIAKNLMTQANMIIEQRRHQRIESETRKNAIIAENAMKLIQQKKKFIENQKAISISR